MRSLWKPLNCRIYNRWPITEADSVLISAWCRELSRWSCNDNVRWADQLASCSSCQTGDHRYHRDRHLSNKQHEFLAGVEDLHVIFISCLLGHLLEIVTCREHLSFSPQYNWPKVLDFPSFSSVNIKHPNINSRAWTRRWKLFVFVTKLHLE